MNKQSLLASLYNKIGADPAFESPKLGTVLVPGLGDIDSPVIFIGEAPGREEELARLPFVGPAGKNLDALLDRIGWQRSKVFITNLVKFRPTNAARTANRKPTARESAAGVRYLLKELEILNPKWVVCLGGSSAESLLGRPVKMGAENGTAIDVGERGFRLYLAYHPSPFNYNNPRRREDIEMAFDRLAVMIGDL